jgi:PAS domain S-box-containing protein
VPSVLGATQSLHISKVNAGRSRGSLIDAQRHPRKLWAQEVALPPLDEPRDATLRTLLAEIERLRSNEDQLEAEISQLRETVAELEAACARQVDPFDLAPVACLTLDRHGAIRNANRRALMLLGVNRHQLLGIPLLMLLTSGSRRRFLEHVVATRRSVEPTTFEVTVSSRERGTVPARLSIRWTEDGAENYAVALVDLSERNAAFERGACAERARLQAEHVRERLIAPLKKATRGSGTVWSARGTTWQRGRRRGHRPAR